MSLVCTLNEQYSGICGEASYRGKCLTLAEHGRNRMMIIQFYIQTVLVFLHIL